MFITRPDARLFALEFGSAAPTLVALGGWIGSGEVWWPTLSPLSRRWRVIAYDHRGSGATQCDAPRITAADMVDDLFAVLDHFGVQRCVLCAESAGAGIALQAALRAPGRFDGLVLAGASPWQTRAGEQAAFIEALRHDFAGTVQRFAALCVPEAGADEIRRWGAQILLRSDARRAIELIECRTELDVQSHLHRIATRTLLLHGTRDAIEPPERVMKLAFALRQSALQWLDGAGHAPMMTRPDDVAAAIEAMFGQATARPT